ncbi:MAG: DUF2868 domain-containing protein [Desulfamplus sp.]|nr:DUF2868 domain-containing protein [Desulfamplus sp.]
MKWTLGRIIDFEYFLRQDMRCNDNEYLKKRDRDIYNNYILPKGVTSRKEMLFLWLNAVKESINNRNNSSDIFIGDMYEESLTILKAIFIVIGVMTGISLCIAFFSYTGQHPLNVAYFFALTLIPQICLLFILLASFIISRLKPYINLPSNVRSKTVRSNGALSLFTYPLIGLIIENIFMAIKKRAIEKLFVERSAEQRELFMSTIGIIRQEHQVYGSLFLIQTFILMQIFGIAFNLGVLLSTLFRVFFFDTAFGWQSTLQISPELVYNIVKIVATPWSWIFPDGVGFPDINQIVGSRIVLKDGIYHLTTDDLVSWWPFICLTILFYGLLPRVIMFCSGLVALKRSLENQNFDHGDCLNLVKRMVTVDVPTKQANKSHNDSASPIISKPDPVEFELNLSMTNFTTKSYIGVANIEPHIVEVSNIAPHIEKINIESHIEVANIEPHIGEVNIESHIKEFKREKPKISYIEDKAFVALIPNDIYELINIDRFKHLMKEQHCYEVRKTLSFGIDFDKEIDSIKMEYDSIFDEKNGSDKDKKNNNFGVIILQEAWLPPIRENLNFIRKIREVVDKRTPIIVVLTGKEGDTDFLNHVEKSDYEIWKIKISTIADPWLNIQTLKV